MKIKMNIYQFIISSCLALMLLFGCEAAFANGFQNISWGSRPALIIKKFPSVQEKKASEVLMNTFIDCKGKDSESRKCSLADDLCQNHGIGCFPSLILSEYMVGSLPFRVTFNFSKINRLSGVDLHYSKSLVSEETFVIKRIFDKIQSDLSLKYGNPFRQDAYIEQAGVECQIKGMCLALGNTEWRSKATRITLRIAGKFDPVTNKFVSVGGEPELNIFYEPIVSEAASKL